MNRIILVLITGLLSLSTGTFADNVSVDSKGNISIGVLNINGNFEVTGELGKYAIVGYSMSTAAGVYGINIPGNNYGVLGDDQYGVYGSASGADGIGVYGMALYSGSAMNYGGYFEASGIYGYGVFGIAHGINGIGVVGSGGNIDFYAAGSGLNYMPFTGAHEVILSNEISENIKTGMIVSVTGQAKIREDRDGIISISSTLPTVRLSGRPNDKAVFGVYVKESSLPEGHWYEKREGEKFGIVNALGEGRVWVTNMNGDIEVGDYITTSSVPGYGQRQEDDVLHSYTLGKAIEDVDWDYVAETIDFMGQKLKIYLVAVVYTSG